MPDPSLGLNCCTDRWHLICVDVRRRWRASRTSLSCLRRWRAIDDREARRIVAGGRVW